MSPQPNDGIQISIPKLFYEKDISQTDERLMASYLSGCMLWPYVKHYKTRYFYYALCYREIFAVVEKTIPGETYASLQYCWVKNLFGSFDAYTQILAGNPLFPSKGKGSLTERAWMGYIAGLVFKLALDDGCSLNEAAKAVAGGMATKIFCAHLLTISSKTIGLNFCLLRTCGLQCNILPCQSQQTRLLSDLTLPPSIHNLSRSFRRAGAGFCNTHRACSTAPLKRPENKPTARCSILKRWQRFTSCKATHYKVPIGTLA